MKNMIWNEDGGFAMSSVGEFDYELEKAPAGNFVVTIEWYSGHEYYSFADRVSALEFILQHVVENN